MAEEARGADEMAIEHSLQNSAVADRSRAASGPDRRRPRVAVRRLRDAPRSPQEAAGRSLDINQRSTVWFKRSLARVRKRASELATMDDARSLLLLDVTELGTRLYSIHSMVSLNIRRLATYPGVRICRN